MNENILKRYSVKSTAILAGKITYEEYNKNLAARKARGDYINAGIYDKMRRTDPQVNAVLLAAELPLRSATWYVEPPHNPTDEEKLATELVNIACFDKLEQPWDEFIKHALLHLQYGFSLCEIVYKFETLNNQFLGHRYLLWKEFSPIPARTVSKWIIDEGDDIKEIEQQAWRGSQAITLRIPVERLLHFAFRMEGKNYEGISALRPAYPYYEMKDMVLRCIVINHERFGTGTLIWSLPEDATDDDVKMIEEISEEFRSNERSYIVKPRGIDLDIQFPHRAMQDPIDILRYYDEKILDSLLAGVFGLGRTAIGSRALGETLGRPFYLGLQAIGNYICEVFTGGTSRAMSGAIARLVHYNFGYHVRLPRLKVKNIETKNIEAFIRSIANAVKAGIISTDANIEEIVRKELGLPIPEMREEEKEIEETKELLEENYFEKIKDIETYDPSKVRNPQLRDDFRIVCLPEGSLVFGNPEPLEIEKLEYKKVYTHLGPNKVTKVFKRKYEGEIIEVKIQGFPAVQLTPEHPVLVIKRKKCGNKGTYCNSNCKTRKVKDKRHPYTKCPLFKNYKLEWIPAKELESSHAVIIPKNSYETVNYVNLVDFIPSEDLQLNIFGKFVKSNKTLEKFDFRTQLPYRIKIDNKFGELLGWYLAEGFADSNHIYFSLGKDEVKEAYRIKKLIEDIFDRKVSIRTTKRNNEIRISCASKYLSIIFKNLFKNRAKEKRIPHIMYKADKEAVRSFLKAYFKGDGCKIKNKYQLSTTSKYIAFGLPFLFSKLDFYPFVSKSLKKSNFSKDKRTVYDISFTGNFETQKIPKEIWSDDNFTYVPVKEVKISNYSGYVFNLEVEKAETYACPFIVHNCAWYSTILAGKEFKYTKEQVEDLATKIVAEIVRRWKAETLVHTFRPKEMTEAARKLFEVVRERIEIPEEMIEKAIEVEADEEFQKTIEQFKDMFNPNFEWKSEPKGDEVFVSWKKLEDYLATTKAVQNEIVRPILGQIRADFIRRARPLVEKGLIGRIRTMKIPEVYYKQLSEALKRYYLQTAEWITKETEKEIERKLKYGGRLERQRKKLVTVVRKLPVEKLKARVKTKKFIEQMAKIKADELITEMRTRLINNAIDAAMKEDLSILELKAQVPKAKTLTAITHPVVLETISRAREEAAIGVAKKLGKKLGHVFFVSQLDKNTCDLCRKAEETCWADGGWPIDSQKYYYYKPPFRSCKGTVTRCRCTYIYDLVD